MENNSGDYNSGWFNSGNRNSGDCNSGWFNSGNRNSGNRNSGDYNSGDYNSGWFNSGNRNSGDFNSGDRNSGGFNTDEPKMRMFNKDTDYTYTEFCKARLRPSFQEFDLNTWIREEMMTDKEKEENPSYKTTGGYLKTLKYKEAWAVFWRKTDEKNRQKFLKLPNFDAKIFKEITGVDVDQPLVKEFTLAEVAEKMGVDVKQLRIKE
jgi:hypothetical protein